MRERTRSALVIVPLVVLAVAGGGVGIGLLAVILALLAAREVERLLAAAGRPAVRYGVIAGAVFLVAAAAIPAILGSDLLGRPAGALDLAASLAAVPGLASVGLVAAVLALAAFARRDPADGFDAWSASLFGAVYVGLLGAVAILTTQWTDPGRVDLIVLPERRWVVVLLAAVWSFDSGAYLVGRAVGRRPFFPWISPQKTVEGVAGGVVAATLGVAAVLALTSGAWPEALVLGPLLGIAAQAGDLVESLLKRAAGVKDAGSLLPGHGGVLDRVDSILLAAPVLVAWVALVHG